MKANETLVAIAASLESNRTLPLEGRIQAHYITLAREEIKRAHLIDSREDYLQRYRERPANQESETPL